MKEYVMAKEFYMVSNNLATLLIVLIVSVSIYITFLCFFVNLDGDIGVRGGTVDSGGRMLQTNSDELNIGAYKF